MASLVAQLMKNLHCRRPRFDPWVGKILWGREWLPTPVFLPGEFHGQRSLVEYIIHEVTLRNSCLVSYQNIYIEKYKSG